MKKILFSAVALMLMASSASAAKFSVAGGGVSIIDANGTADYLSLAEASADFTAYPGGSVSDWTLLIRSDLDETTPSVFGNNTNGRTVTVRPAPTTSVTVTFNINTRPTGPGGIIWDGNIVVGPSHNRHPSEDPNDPSALQYRDTDNFILDGCNTPGGTARNLTLLTPSSAEITIPRYMIRVVGGVDDSIIRNCSIICNAIHTTEYMGILYNARYIATGALLYIPQRASVINNFIKVNRGNTGRGFYSFSTGTFTPAEGIDAMRGYVVSNNDIEVSHRAVQFGLNAGGQIIGNRITVTQETAGQRPEVIIHTGSNKVTFDWTTDIIGNHFRQISAKATTGLNYAIGVGTIPAVGPATHTYNIINNMIGGFSGDANITVPTSWLYRGISIENGVNAGATFNIRHNSINMADIPTYNPASVADAGNRLVALSLLNADGFAGTLNFDNNILRYSQHTGEVISARTAPTPAQEITTSSLNFSNNTYFHDNNTTFAHLNNMVYTTLASWQSATGKDTGSNSVDPFNPPSGGKWKSDVDQHFDALPSTVFDGVISVPPVTTDIDGDLRVVPPTKGADRYSVTSSIGSWSVY